MPNVFPLNLPVFCPKKWTVVEKIEAYRHQRVLGYFLSWRSQPLENFPCCVKLSEFHPNLVFIDEFNYLLENARTDC